VAAETAGHLRIEGVSHAFRRSPKAPAVPALADVSLSVARHGFVAILGPSGCGKTTLLRLAAGLIAPDRGVVRIDGAPPRPGVQSSFVFQSFRLIPWETARGNVEFALRSLPEGLDAAARHERAERYLRLVGLARVADAYPGEMSGGMKQRLALARALACESGLLLMDEPFASLDAQARELMQDELIRLWSLRRPTVLFVTHSVDEAILLADRVVLMSPRPGRILEDHAIGFPRPRRADDLRASPAYAKLRQHLWSRIRDLVLSDPESDFYGRASPGQQGDPA
jgi:NitT/TauT family transport system ATP-binding protein